MILGGILAHIYTILVWREGVKVMFSLQIIFLGLANVTIVFLGSNNGRNTHTHVPI
jgi:hypothetical protein